MRLPKDYTTVTMAQKSSQTAENGEVTPSVRMCHITKHPIARNYLLFLLISYSEL